MEKKERGQENGECLLRDRKVFKLMRPLCSHLTIAMLTFQRHQAHNGCRYYVTSTQQDWITRELASSRIKLCNYYVARFLLADFEIRLCLCLPVLLPSSKHLPMLMGISSKFRCLRK